VTAPKTPGAASSHTGFAARVDWRTWSVPVALAATVLLTGLLYWPSTQSLLFEWFEVPASAYRHGSLIVAINPGLDSHSVPLPPLGDAAAVLSHRCQATHSATGWTLRVGARGYGVFTVR